MHNQTLTLAALDLQQLPDDSFTLKGLIVELVQTLQEKQQHADHLQARLDQLLRRLYGRRSERLDPSQLALFASDQQASPEDAAVGQENQAGKDTPQPRRRRGQGHGRQRLPEYLQRRIIRHELTEAERGCPCCGEQRTPLGEQVSEQLEYVAASVLVHQHVRVTYVCSKCERQRRQPAAQTDSADVAQPTTATDPPARVSAATAAPLSCPGSAAVATELTDPTHSGMLPTAAAVAVPLTPRAATLAGVALEESGSMTATESSDVPGATAPTLATPLATTTAVVTTAVAANDNCPGSTGNSADTLALPGSADASRALPASGSTIVTAPLPPQPLPKCLAGPGLLAHVIVSKFVDHLPLYRQEQIFLRQGVWLSRRTLCDWLAGCAKVLQPLFTLLWQSVFCSRDLHTDDTPVTVQGKQTKGHLWVYLGDAAHPYVVYDFTLGRGQERPLQCLSGFKGHLHADAYNGYDKVFGKDRIEVGCWAHARRYFYDARQTDPVPACCVLSSIGRLYALEAAAKYAAQVRDLSDEEYWDVRQQLRERQAKPILSGLAEYAQKTRAQVLPRSPLGEAFTYLNNQWLALGRYVEHGFLDIDNNVAEQALRAIGIGRKNWLFLGSEEGGKTAATLYSLTQTCKRHGIDPWYYLREVLRILPTIAESAHATELPKLLPDQWAKSERQRHSGAAPPDGGAE